MATHYTCLMGRCREKGGKDCLALASKVSITLLRYSDFIPADKCFYQARVGATLFSGHSIFFVCYCVVVCLCLHACKHEYGVGYACTRRRLSVLGSITLLFSCV